MIVLVAAIVAAAVVAVVVFDGRNLLSLPTAPPPGFDVPELNVAPGAAVPTVTAVATGSVDVSAWAERLSERTHIPARSLVAYAQAEIVVGQTAPGCNINWATLAGVGRVESHHGQYSGRRIGSNGVVTPPIVGVPLDGSPGLRAVPDTDGGRLDGDTRWDRAVGAMQFLPTTWERWGTRASGDGAAADPQNIDDAVLSAARFLCASGRDLSNAEGWWKAVMSYNQSVAYGRDVFSGADAYARAAATL